MHDTNGFPACCHTDIHQKKDDIKCNSTGRSEFGWGGEGCVSSPQRGVCRCVYCCDGVEGGEEEEVFGEGLLAKEEESDRCSSSSFFKYSSLRANNSL